MFHILICTTLVTEFFMTVLGAQPVVVKGKPTWFSAEHQDAVIGYHNRYRRMETASNMMKLTYNLELQQSAQWAANNCKFSHTPGSSRRYGNQAAGENIFVTTDSATTGIDLEEAVHAWWKEISDYSYHSNSCTSGKDCGHYTAVVAANTRELGCGVTFCDNIINWGNSDRSGYVMFCHYGPIHNGARPYRQGEACTDCPSDAGFCDYGLCSLTEAVITEAPPITPAPTMKQCVDGWYTSGAKCYKYFTQKVNYESAQAICAENNAVVAMPKSEAEQNDFKESRSSSTETIWLGAVYDHNAMMFTWADHTRMAPWQNWHRGGQPAYIYRNKYCVKVQPNGYWRNNKCTPLFRFVCQRDN